MRELKTARPIGEMGTSRLLICAEGFEPRSLKCLSSQVQDTLFEHSIVLQNIPLRKESLYGKLLELTKSLTRGGSVQTIPYYRFEPARTELALVDVLHSRLAQVDCIVVDVSVMSKLLIVMLLNLFGQFERKVSLIYSEPVDYAPSEEEYSANREMWSQFYSQPAFGVHSVVRTSLLTSVVMQRSPSLVVAFSSFNEQLIPALLNECSPSRLIVINGIPPRLSWRAQATQEIAEPIIREYRDDNPKDDRGRLVRSVSTLDYREALRLLAEIYRNNSYANRVTLAPTGSKMQAVACGLLRIRCRDIHVEYPTPESFFVPGFSSQETVETHELTFDDFTAEVTTMARDLGVM